MFVWMQYFHHEGSSQTSNQDFRGSSSLWFRNLRNKKESDLKSLIASHISFKPGSKEDLGCGGSPGIFIVTYWSFILRNYDDGGDDNDDDMMIMMVT